MTQIEIAKSLGVTFQQIQKYENGKNRLTAGRLTAAAKALGVSPSYFFEELGRNDPDAQQAQSHLEKLASFTTSAEADFLMSNFIQIASAETRQNLLTLIRSMAEQPSSNWSSVAAPYSSTSRTKL